MTKDELADFVKIAYATFNENLNEMDRKWVYRAWFGILHDISYDDARAAFTQIATTARFLPRPGEVRRRAIDNASTTPKPPDPYAAWGILQEIIRDVNSGNINQTPKHPALVEAMKRLGDGLGGMHTNGDREVFVRVYSTVVEELESAKYEVPILSSEILYGEEKSQTKVGV
jgi:hypothetical protein